MGRISLGPQAAVDAQGVGPEARAVAAKLPTVQPVKVRPAGLKAHAGQHRQSAGFLAGQQGSFQLVQGR